MKHTRLIFLILLLPGSCLTVTPPGRLYAEDESEAPRYWETTVANPRGLVIVVHGLNVKPSKMGTPSAEGTLVKLLLDSGYHVCRVTLKGHAGPLEDMRTITRSDWMHDAYVHYCRAKTIAGNGGLPLYLLGFSLGALVYEVLMNEATATPVRFEKAILFSPAVAIKPAAKTVLWLKPFANDGTIIGSVSPEDYRAQTGASIAAYKAVFDMEESLLAASFRNCNVATIIFIDKNDEMVSVRILRERIRRYGLTNWKIYETTNDGAVIRPRYHHLIIDNKCVSASTWRSISGTIAGFLD